MEMELRFNSATMETTPAEDGTLKVSGYVNKTNQPSQMLGRESRFKEIIKPGVWTRAIEKAKEVHFYAEHDKNKILSSTRNGSLELREDDNGLYMTATISPTSWGKDYYQLIKDGILQNMSFGFRAVKDSWRNMGDYFERTINDLELFEVSVVRDPAYAQSSISARGIDLVEDEVPVEERNLRTIEIRSDADIQAIAEKLFEMLSANVKVAEQQNVEVDVIDDSVVDTTDPDGDGDDDTTPAGDTDNDVVEPGTGADGEDPATEAVEQVLDEATDELIEEIAPDLTATQKIRDFINQYK